MPKPIKRLIAALFLLFLAGAVYFQLERMLFADASYILFRIVNFESLQIQEHRYGSFVTQLFPLLGAKLQLPLKTIVLLYSISFTGFYLVVILALLFWFDETELALLMAFYFTLLVSDSWFWTNNEVNQGIAWMFLFFGAVGWLDKRKASLAFSLPVFAILSFLALITHPLVMFPTLFLWGFFLLNRRYSFSRKRLLLFTLFLLAVSFLRLAWSNGSSSHYDAGKLHNLKSLNLPTLAAAFRTPMVKELARQTVFNYWLLPLIFGWGVYAMVRQKKRSSLLLLLAFAGVYTVATCVTFDDFTAFYTENEWMPLTIILCAPFVFFGLPKWKPSYAITAVAFVFCVRTGYIAVASKKWVARREWMEATLQDMRSKRITKAIVPETPENRKLLIMNWGAPTESLLASALANEYPQRSFVVGTPESLKDRQPAGKTQLISCFELYTNGSLNPRYFVFDSTTDYQSLPR